MSSENELRREIVELTQQLLESITTANWAVYTKLCVEDLTAFEPEASTHLVSGMPFHQHYFDMANDSPYVNVTTTISSPHVRFLGEQQDVAVIAYARLTQRVADGQSQTTVTPETRVWERRDGKWLHVHFHRS